MILKKLATFNSEVPSEKALSASQLAAISALKSSFSREKLTPVLPFLAEMILTWPSGKRFPAIDIVRLAAVKTRADVCGMNGGGLDLVDILINGAEMTEGVMDGRTEADVNSLLALRGFVNLFEGEEGKRLMVANFEKVCPSRP
jgi:hypothetical protein